MPTLNELRNLRNRGPSAAEIDQNRRVQYDTAMESAHAAIDAAATAVTTVSAAATLVEAQGAVSGLAATLGDALTNIESVRADLA